MLQPDRTRSGAQEQRIGAGTLSRHDDLGLRLPGRRPAEEPEPLGEFVELEVGEDAERVLLDLVGRYALSARVTFGPASCPRADPERLVECSKVTFLDVSVPSAPPRGMLVHEYVALEGAPHRRSATGLPGPDLQGRGPGRTLERLVIRGNQRTDRPPFDLVHHPSTDQPEDDEGELEL
jgi:hypothetical protein